MIDVLQCEGMFRTHTVSEHDELTIDPTSYIALAHVHSTSYEDYCNITQAPFLEAMEYILIHLLRKQDQTKG